MPAFAKLFADILVIPNKFLKDSYLRNTLIKVRGVVFRELGVQP